MGKNTIFRFYGPDYEPVWDFLETELPENTLVRCRAWGMFRGRWWQMTVVVDDPRSAELLTDLIEQDPNLSTTMPAALMRMAGRHIPPPVVVDPTTSETQNLNRPRDA